MESLFKHYYLYAKGHYKETELIDDLYTIYEKVYNNLVTNPSREKKLYTVYNKVIELFFTYSSHKNKMKSLSHIFVQGALNINSYSIRICTDKDKQFSREQIIISVIKQIFGFLLDDQVYETIDGHEITLLDLGEADRNILPLSRYMFIKENNINSTKSHDKAIELFYSGVKYTTSTDISDEISRGYGKLDGNGFWEFPLVFNRNEKEIVS